MTADRCSWCGAHGPFPAVHVGAAAVLSAYCVRCVTVRNDTGAYPPRDAATKARLVAAVERLRAAREGA